MLLERERVDPLLLDLPPRVLTALTKNHVRRIEEVARRNRMELRQLDGLGPASIEEIRDLLSSYDIDLETELSDAPLYYGEQPDLLSWLIGYRDHRWWKKDEVDALQQSTPIRGWIRGDAFECTMELGSNTVSVSASLKNRKVECSCGYGLKHDHALIGFLLLCRDERREILFDDALMKEKEDAPRYQPLSHDPLFHLLDDTVRNQLLDNDVYWVEELAARSPEDLLDLRGIGTKRREKIISMLEDLNLHPGRVPESVDRPPGDRFPPDLGRILLNLQRNTLNSDRGSTYFRRERVRRLDHVSDTAWEARVQGRELYDVQMDLAGEDYRCSCPVTERRGPCKHIFATALAVARRKRLQVLTGRPDRTISDELVWLKGYANSEQDQNMSSSNARYGEKSIYFCLCRTRDEWGLLPTTIDPREGHPDLPAEHVPDRNPISTRRGLPPKVHVVLQHLDEHYYGVPPSQRSGMLGEVLPMLSGSEVFVQTGEDRFQEADFADEELTPEVELTVLDEGHVRLEPRLRRGEEQISAPEFDLINSNPAWYRVGHRLYRSVYDSFFEDLLERTNGDALMISEEDASVFVEDILPGLMDRDLPLRIPEASMEKKDLELVPRVYLSEANDQLRVDLRFAYGSVEFTQRSDGSFPIPDPDGDSFVRVERDGEREKSFLRALRETGLVPVTRREQSRLTAEQDRTKWVIDELPDLPDKGFEVFGQDELDQRPEVREPVRSRAVLSKEIDWFEVEGEMEYETGSVPFHELLEHIRRDEKYVRLAEGEYGEIPDEWIHRFSGLDDLTKTEEDELRAPGLSISEMNELLDEADEVETDRAVDTYRRFYREFDGIDPAEEPSSFNGTLRDYQRAGLSWMRFLRRFGFGGLLADDMGLGKTVQVLAFIQHVREEIGTMPDTLVVAPRSVLRNWEKEANRFLPDPPLYRHHGPDRRTDEHEWPENHLSFTTYGTMRSDVEWLRTQDFDTIVLDEIQAIRNPETKQAKASRLLSAEHRLGLSGTPVQNTVLDLWSEFQFLNPGLLGNRSYFEQRFADPIEERRDDHRSERLQALLQPFLLRRTKEQVEKQLPELSRSIVDCSLSEGQKDLYESYRRYFREEVSETMDEQGVRQSQFKVLEGLTRLRQICCHPSLVEDGNDDTPSGKLDEFLERVREVIDEGHRALVFSQFVQFLEIIENLVQREGWSYQYLDGSTRDREERVREFQEDDSIPLFLISLKAGGEGLNLTGADYVFLMDPWWNPAVEQQAMDRTHRIGQDQPVLVYRLICPGTIEEKMLALQEKKETVAENVVTPEAGVFKDMDREELLDLFT